MVQRRGEILMMKKLFNWIFAKPKEVKPVWTIEQNGWEHNAEKYEEFHKYMASVMMRGQE